MFRKNCVMPKMFSVYNAGKLAEAFLETSFSLLHVSVECRANCVKCAFCQLNVHGCCGRLNDGTGPADVAAAIAIAPTII